MYTYAHMYVYIYIYIYTHIIYIYIYIYVTDCKAPCLPANPVYSVAAVWYVSRCAKVPRFPAPRFPTQYLIQQHLPPSTNT